MINNNNIDYTALAVARLTDQMQQIENQKSRAAIISQIDATIDSIKIEKAKLKDQDTSELDELLYECLMKKKRLYDTWDNLDREEAKRKSINFWVGFALVVIATFIMCAVIASI